MQPFELQACSATRHRMRWHLIRYQSSPLSNPNTSKSRPSGQILVANRFQDQIVLLQIGMTMLHGLVLSATTTMAPHSPQFFSKFWEHRPYGNIFVQECRRQLVTSFLERQCYQVGIQWNHLDFVFHFLSA